MAQTSLFSSPAAEDPLRQSLARITGVNPLAATTGTSSSVAGTSSPISYERPFAIGGDTISIQSSPGTGVSTAETWSHEAQQAQQALNERKFAEDKARADREWAWTQGAQAREEQAYLRRGELERQQQEQWAKQQARRLTVNGQVVGGPGMGIQRFGEPRSKYMFPQKAAEDRLRELYFKTREPALRSQAEAIRGWQQSVQMPTSVKGNWTTRQAPGGGYIVGGSKIGGPGQYRASTGLAGPGQTGSSYNREVAMRNRTLTDEVSPELVRAAVQREWDQLMMARLMGGGGNTPGQSQQTQTAQQNYRR